MNNLTIGSYPGIGQAANPFFHIFLGALQDQGARLVSFADAGDIDCRDLDVLLVHFPDKIFTEGRGRLSHVRGIARFLYRLARRPRRCKLVWLVHDIQPPELHFRRRLLWNPLVRGLIRLVDGWLTLAPGTVPVVKRIYPGLANKPAGSVWHPLYPDQLVSEARRREIRAALDLPENAFVYGNCGLLRPYKGLRKLSRVFQSMPDPDIRLLIAGSPLVAEIADTLEADAQADPRIRLVARDLSDEDFRDMLAAADVIVAPFVDYLHSGSIVHALSAGKPVLTPAVPYSVSLAEALPVPGWLTLYDGDLTQEELRRARHLSPQGPLDLSPLAPERVAADALAFFASLSEERPGPGRGPDPGGQESAGQ